MYYSSVKQSLLKRVKRFFLKWILIFLILICKIKFFNRLSLLTFPFIIRESNKYEIFVF
jgi:hypothetical protein